MIPNTWKHLPSWLRAAATSAAQGLATAVLLTVLGVLNDASNAKPIDWLGVLDDLRLALILAAHAVTVAVWRRVRPPEASYPG